MQAEDVADRGLQRLAGDERAGGRFHELGGDAQLLARPQQRPDESVVHVELRRDPSHVEYRLGAEPSRRQARPDDERWNPASELMIASASP